MTKNKIKKKGFKTSWLLKKSQNRAPGKTGISREMRNFRNFFSWFFPKIKFSTSPCKKNLLFDLRSHVPKLMKNNYLELTIVIEKLKM